MRIIIAVILCITLATTNAFWWGSSSNEREEEEPIKKIPVHLIRTLTYHPVLIPGPPVSPLAAPPPPAFQYARGFLSSFPSNLAQQSQQMSAQSSNLSPNNYYTIYQTNPPSSYQSTTTTTQRPTAPPTTTTTLASSTTTEAITTQQENLSTGSRISGKSPLLADRFSSGFPFDYSNGMPQTYSASGMPGMGGMQGNMGSMGAPTFGGKGPQDPMNLQYVTNIAPMNVQFVPCMCPVEVRIAPPDQQHQQPIDNKASEDTLLEANMNDLDDNME